MTLTKSRSFLKVLKQQIPLSNFGIESTFFKTARGFANNSNFKMILSYDLYVPSGDKEQNLSPVIMMHGMLDSKKTFKYIAPRIANLTGRKVYAVDARNHGESPWNENLTFDINADDMDLFLTQHRIPKAVFVGHSMGGRTAITLALRKPEVVERIVIEDMNLINFKPNKSNLIVEVIKVLRESLSTIPPGVDLDTAKETVAEFIASLITTSESTKKRRLDLSMIPLKQDGKTFSWQANLNVLEDMLSTEKIRQDLKGMFMGEALFIYGTKSFFHVDKDTLIPKMFPNATMKGVEGATHLLHFEFPRKFIEEVSAFINNNSGLKSKY